MASRDHTSPIEQLFLEAGFNYLQYQRWRIIDLPGLKTKDAIERLDRGWPIASFDDADNEARLAKAWLDSNAPGAATDQEREAPEPPPASGGPLYGPLMTSREAKELIDEEIAAGRPVSTTAFQRALRRAAREARQAPDTLPLRLGGSTRTGCSWSWARNLAGTATDTGYADESNRERTISSPTSPKEITAG